MIGIDFAHPSRLWLGLALIPAAAWAARGARLRARDWGAFGQSGRPPRDGAAWRLAAVALLVAALAQPRWGRAPGDEVPEGHDVVLCVDVSRSMAAEDASPDRLGVAIEAASGLLRAIGAEPGPRVAVVAFAGRAVVRCPLTSDLGAAGRAIRALRAGEVQPGGTDLGAALGASAGAFDARERVEGRTIVVLTDGEDHAGSWPEALGRLRTGGILVHAVAIGDPDRGHPVPGGRPDLTRRSDEALGAIARGTGGALIPLGLASADLGALYRDRIAPTARQRRDEIRPPGRPERFGAFVLAAAGATLAGSWPGRVRRPRRLARFAVPALAASVLGAAPAGDPAGGLVESGRVHYGAGRFAEALGAFERAIALDPLAAVPRYDAASALFQLGRYPEAIARYEEARDRADPGLMTRVDYALGNARLALGEIPRALAHYDACLASTWPGPEFDAVRRDAAENRAFAASRAQAPPEEPGGGAPDPGRPSPGGGRDPGDNGAGGDPSGRAPSPGTSPEPAGKEAPGGPGDEGSPPPEAAPEARLDAALREIREARGRRPPDAAPAGPGRAAKDW